MNFNKTSDKLMIALQSCFSLHEADALHNMIVNDKYTEEDCIHFINEAHQNIDDDVWLEKHIK